VTHEHLSFNCLNCFKSNADEDEDGCTADSQAAETIDITQHLREESNKAEEDSTHKCDLVKNASDEITCWSAWAEAWDEAAVLTKIIGNLDWVELDC